MCCILLRLGGSHPPPPPPHLLILPQVHFSCFFMRNATLSVLQNAYAFAISNSPPMQTTIFEVQPKPQKFVNHACLLAKFHKYVLQQQADSRQMSRRVCVCLWELCGCLSANYVSSWLGQRVGARGRQVQVSNGSKKLKAALQLQYFLSTALYCYQPNKTCICFSPDSAGKTVSIWWCHVS